MDENENEIAEIKEVSIKVGVSDPKSKYSQSLGATYDAIYFLFFIFHFSFFNRVSLMERVQTGAKINSCPACSSPLRYSWHPPPA